MSNNRILLEDIIKVLKEIRPWVSADYYRENIVPITNRIRDELVLINTDEFFLKKKSQVQHNQLKDFSTTERQDFKFTEPDELDTIPNKILEATSNFGMFDEHIKGPLCKKHPNAPHRYLKELSESMGRYVCYCEFWEPK